MVLQSIMDSNTAGPHLDHLTGFIALKHMVFSSKFKGTAGVVRHMRLICHEDNAAVSLMEMES